MRSRESQPTRRGSRSSATRGRCGPATWSRSRARRPLTIDGLIVGAGTDVRAGAAGIGEHSGGARARGPRDASGDSHADVRHRHRTRFAEVARAHQEFFAASPPASTMVEVRRLAHPDMMIEIEADAYAGTATVGTSQSRKRRSSRSPQRRSRPRNRRAASNGALWVERGGGVDSFGAAGGVKCVRGRRNIRLGINSNQDRRERGQPNSGDQRRATTQSLYFEAALLHIHRD